MIDRLVAFALEQQFITLALAVVLTAARIASYHRLPIEAYPDVGDVRVEVITLWPGHPAKEVERLITIPLENELNGIADVTFLRSDTLFGLSNIRGSSSPAAPTATGPASRRRSASPRPTSRPTPGRPSARSRASSARFSGTPCIRNRGSLIELKALQNWVLEREFRKIPGVADVVSWGGGTKQYQVNVDPSRLRGYNLTLKQVFDAVQVMV